MQLTVDYDNFHAVRGKLWVVRNVIGGRQGYQYEMPNSFDELQDGQVCIAMSAMLPEDLIKLSMRVGFLNREIDQFEYTMVTLEDFK